MMITHQNKIVITNLELDVSIGIYDFEKTSKQPIIINLEALFSKDISFKDCKIEDTTNYELIIKIIKSCSQDKHNDLIENLAEEIAEKILAEENIYLVQLSIQKPNVLKDEKSGSIGVEITRTKTN